MTINLQIQKILNHLLISSLGICNGAIVPIFVENIEKGDMLKSRRYRNRRLGDFYSAQKHILTLKFKKSFRIINTKIPFCMGFVKKY